jgi:hypothetical protein
VLVVAGGSRLLTGNAGFTGPGWQEKVFTLYDVPARRHRRQRRATSTAAGW